MSPTELETLIQCLSDRRVDPSDVKARCYVGQFFNCRRTGLKSITESLSSHWEPAAPPRSGLHLCLNPHFPLCFLPPATWAPAQHRLAST